MRKAKYTVSLRRASCHVETVYSDLNQQCEFAVKENGLLTYKPFHKIGEQKLRPPRQAEALLACDTLKLPSKAAPYYSLPNLRRDVQSFIHRYVDLPPAFEKISAYYVLLSWQYDQFNEVPYLRVRGDFGTGKTRFLRVIGSLTYNAVFASGASTTAPIFHLLDSIRGTLVLDESDYRYSDATAEITKILNNGHAQGFSVLRCEPTKDGGFVARAYNIFGPKIVASRESFSDAALESRFITHDFDAKKIRRDVPISLPSTFEADAMNLRNQLLWYRLHSTGHSDETVVKNDHELSCRSLQVYLPLLSLVEEKSDRESIITFIRNQEAQLRSDRGLQTEAEVLEVIMQVAEAEPVVSLSALTKTFMIRYGKRYSRRITPKWIGYLLRSRLHLCTRKSGGVYIISEGQNDRLNALYRKFDITQVDGEEST